MRDYLSYSGFRIWSECPWKYKLNYVEEIGGFTGNEFTAFGSAVHNTCENVLLEKITTKQAGLHFQQQFKKELEELDFEHDPKLALNMYIQGKRLAPLAVPALKEYFGECEIVSVEEDLYESIEGHDLKFKGFVDVVVKTPDGKHHVIDWKTCSWGWDARKKSDKLTTYQLTLYKYFYAKKHNIDPSMIETHFALLKRTANKNIVELFRVTSGKIKMNNAFKSFEKALYNIKSKMFVKNRLSCNGCEFYRTDHCP